MSSSLEAKTDYMYIEGTRSVVTVDIIGHTRQNYWPAESLEYHWNEAREVMPKVYE